MLPENANPPAGQDAGGGKGITTADSTPPAAGTQAQLAAFAECVFEPGDIAEVRRLPSGRSTWHAAADLPGLADALGHDNTAGQNVYVGVNPRKSAGGRDAASVALARALVADFDECTVEEARDRWTAAGLPPATLTVASGHGVHCYLRLAEPFTDLLAWSCWQKALAKLLDADPSIHDAPRILRLPGTVNLKDSERPVECRIVEADPSRVYPLADLDEVIRVDDAELPSPARLPAYICGDAGVVQPTNGDGQLPALNRNAERAANYARKFPGSKKGGRHDALYKVCACLRRDFALSEEEAWPIAAEWNEQRNIPPLPDEEVRKQLQCGSRYGKYVRGAKCGNDQAHTDKAQSPFPVDALPEPVRSFVTAVAEAIGCDASYVALPTLVALASAVGNTRRVQLKRAWTEPCILWGAIICQSGTLKSPAIDAALNPLRAVQARLLGEHAAQMEEYERRRLEYEVELAEWRKRRSKSSYAGEPPEKPQKPAAVRHLVSDITVEALATILEENPRGVLLARDELAGWLGSFDAYKNSKADTANWLECHRAGTVVVDRKTGDKRIVHIPRAAVSVIGGVQPEILKMLLGREHFQDGLAARLLLVQPPRPDRRWSDADVPDELAAQMDGLFTRLLGLQFGTDPDGRPTPAILPLSAGAKAAFVGFYNEHGMELAGMDADLASCWSKLEGYAARLAMLIHLVVHVDQAVEVSAESMQAGIALARWFGEQARCVYETLASDAESGVPLAVGTLAQFIRKRGGAVAVREVTQSYRKANKDTATATALLEELVKAGVGIWEQPAPGASGGRPSRVFRLANVPTANETTAGGAENEGSVGVGTVGTPSSEGWEEIIL